MPTSEHSVGPLLNRLPLPPRISANEADFLDTVRAGAAIMVFASHWSIFTGQAASLQSFGRPGVLLFFVLSGFVIASAAARSTAVEFFTARAARLWSVAIPILVFLPLLHYAGPQGVLIEWLASALFFSRWWFLEIPTFGDGPFWSLSYEAGFYLIAGSFLFGGRWRHLFASLSCLAVGPKILLLFPIWLAGAVWFFSGLRLTVVGALAAIPTATILALTGRQRGLLPVEVWAESATFLSDWARGAACLLFVASGLALLPRWHFWLGRWIARRSFTIYLIHYPLLNLTTRTYPPSGLPGAILLGVAVFCVCLAIGTLIEPSAGSWRKAIRALVSRKGFGSGTAD